MIGVDDDIPEGTVGEIIEVQEDGWWRVMFPSDKTVLEADDLELATSEEAATWAAIKVDLEAKELEEVEARAVALPPVREIFATFDTDADGSLSKEEYRRYLHGIGE